MSYDIVTVQLENRLSVAEAMIETMQREMRALAETLRGRAGEQELSPLAIPRVDTRRLRGAPTR
jgi:hypothetical protein